MVTKATPTPLTLFEDTDPLVRFRFREPAELGGGPVDLSTVTAVDVIVKTSKDDADADALYTYTMGAEVTVEDDGSGGLGYSEVTVQWAAANLAEPGRVHYKVVSTDGGLRRLLAFGPLTVENV